MVTILDKVIYGLGALTFVGVSLVIIGFVLMFIFAMIFGFTESLTKVSGNKKKAFGGNKNEK